MPRRINDLSNNFNSPQIYRRYIWNNEMGNRTKDDLEALPPISNQYGSGYYTPQSSFSDPYNKSPRAKRNNQKIAKVIASQSLNEHSHDNLKGSKMITVVRAGPEPRAIIRALIKRSTHKTMPDVLAEISQSLVQSSYKDRVKKLFNLLGEEILDTRELFKAEDVFIAVGQEGISRKIVKEILEDIYYPNNSEAHSMLEYWDQIVGQKSARNTKKNKSVEKHENIYNDYNNPSTDAVHNVVTYPYPGYPDYRYGSIASTVLRRHRRRCIECKDDISHFNEQEKANHVELERLRASLIERERARQFREENESFKEKFRRERDRREREKILKVREQYELERQMRENLFTSRRAQDERYEVEALRKLSARKRQAPVIIQEVIQKEPEPPEIQTVTLRVPSRPTTPLPTKVFSKNKRRGVIEWIGDASVFLSKYRMGKKIGEGHYAVVREGNHLATGREVAIKVYDKKRLTNAMDMVDDEVEIQRACTHPNIARLYAAYETEAEVFMVMELVKGGDLFDSIVRNIRFSEETASMIIHDLSSALYYLHSRNVVHRDIKPENILISEDIQGRISVKLTDFGLATILKGNQATLVCGTPTYIAPEILQEKGYGTEVDNWALGVILYILISGFPPFRTPDRQQTELYDFITKGVYDYPMEFWENISMEARSLIDHLLVTQPRERYTSRDVLCDAWVMTLGGSRGNMHDTHNLDSQSRSRRMDLDRQLIGSFEEFNRLIVNPPVNDVPRN